MASRRDLEDAEIALHKLVTGQKAIKVQQNGRSVEYQQTDIEKLQYYISTLKAELGLTSNRRRPAGVH